MAEHGESKEAALFRKYSSDFKKAMINPVEVASVMYSNRIIDETTRNKITHQNGSLLVDAIEAYVSSQPKRGKKLVKKFESVLKILKDYIPLDSIVESLESEYYASGDDDDDDDGGEHGSKEAIEEAVPSIKAAAKIDPLKKPTQLQAKKSKSQKSKELNSSAMPQSQKKIRHSSVQHQAQAGDTDEASLHLKSNSSSSSQSSIKASTPIPKDGTQELDNQCDSNNLSDPHVKQLAIALQVYASDLSDSGLDTQATLDRIKTRIESHIKKKLEDGLAKDALAKQLRDLTMNALIPMDINDWCYDKLDELCKERDDKMSESKDSSSDDLFEEMSPVFSTDVVYHASLCNLVLSNAGHMGKKGSIEFLSQFGHSIDELSLSLSGTSKMLIACQDNTIYIAFRDHVNLPLRYFCELLHQNKKLVLTGFFSGVMPAFLLLRQLWDLPYFSSKILLQNVVCILFGFKDMSDLVTLGQEVKADPNIKNSCHLFLLEGHLQKIYPDEFLWSETNYGDIYHQTKNIKEIIYLIQQTSDGLKWTKSPLSLEYAGAFESAQFNMKVYHQRVLRGYLDNEDYKNPPRKELVEPVKSLIPSISKVELYQHKHPGGNELSIVITGDNLWFCTSIEVKISRFNVKITTSVESVTQKQLSYNRLLDHECFLPDGRSTNCPIKVYSRFSNANTTDVPMIYNEPDSISFRQSQLAKQTPSQIIQLSFLSALLEQSPSDHSGRPTKRFKQIIKFLQEVSSIVPMESAFFAVASCDSPAASAKIAQAVVNAAHMSSIPVSKLMVVGCSEAHLHSQRLVFSQPSIYNHFYTTGDQYYPRWPSQNYYSIQQQSLLRTRHEKLKKSRSSAMHDSYSVSLSADDHQLPYLERFQKICHKVMTASPTYPLNLICGRNIGELYPISKTVSSPSESDALTPLALVLQNARARLTALSRHHKEASSIATVNSKMLDEVNKIVHNDLKPCVTMLGGFMEKQIKVPLVNSPLDTAKALRTAENSGAIGVWALFSLSPDDIKYVLSSRRTQALVIQIAKFIEGTFSEDVARRRRERDAEPTANYDAKLQFLLQLGRSKTVTCSTDYISYSLERELVSICKERNISTSTSVSSVIQNWGVLFKGTGLVLVPSAYRPLLARWLIWSLNIHQLREGLASYTTVGVIGLVNSGKSTLVNKVFKIETVQGTEQSARTTVPFIYNMDSSVEGLSVIDFPGVDDRDESIGGLAKLLVGLAQMVIFVCGYERFHTSSAMDWMKIFRRDFTDTPILVCLSHADRLYENNCEKDMIPECPESKIPGLKLKFEDELQKIIGDTVLPRKCRVKFCSLTQSRHSPINNDKGRQSMRKVGIFTPEDIGEWIKQALIRDIQQQELADKLESFLVKRSD